MENKEIELTEALENLQHATDEYEEICKESAAFRSRETTALNKLNEAQKMFDMAVAEVKKEAPPNTDWRRKTVTGMSA